MECQFIVERSQKQQNKTKIKSTNLRTPHELSPERTQSTGTQDFHPRIETQKTKLLGTPLMSSTTTTKKLEEQEHEIMYHVCNQPTQWQLRTTDIGRLWM